MLIPADPDERQTYALRIVAQRCLYGVDKNPLAAEMAKLSLWLLTLAKDKPFEFLDHAIRCGDSLVGIHSLNQLRKFNLDGKGEDNSLFLGFLDPKIKEAIALRRQIAEMQTNTVEEVKAQDRMLREANEKIDRLKCAADMLVGAEFLRWDQIELLQDELEDEERDDRDGENWQPSWMKAKKETAQFRRAARTKSAIEVAVHFYDSDIVTFQGECAKWLNGHVTFHWPLEFPEVMVDGSGFDAFMGNPPFMGGRYISGTFGQSYLSYLKSWLANEASGNSDIVAYFYLRANSLLGSCRTAGFVGTKTIAEGDTLDVGLAQLDSMGAVIYSAATSQKWPGTASVLYVRLHWSKDGWSGIRILDEQEVKRISPQLDAMESGTTHPLMQEVVPYQGCYVHGMGFILTVEQKDQLILEDASSKNCIYPCLTGDEFNNSPSLLGNRHIIYLADLNETEAKKYPALWRYLEEHVKPERQTHAGSLSQHWWRFKRPTVPLYEAIWRQPLVLVAPVVTKYLSFAWLPSRLILLNKMYAFINATAKHFSVLQSTIYDSWVRQWSARLGETLQFAPTDCFANFAFPSLTHLDASIGNDYCKVRTDLLSSRIEGLTQVYNRFHDSQETSADIQKLRKLHVELDNAVTAAYGWTDFDLSHGFHQTKQGVRYTISEPARREVLARLLRLNHERYAEEVRQGLHETKPKRATGEKKPKRKKSTTTAAAATVTPTLFDVAGVETAFPATDRDKLLCGLLCDLVATVPGLPVTAYLDALVIALSCKRHNRFLIGKDRTQFTTLAEGLLTTKDQTDDSIPWADLLDLLTQQDAVSRSGSTLLERGSRFDGVRKTYPSCDSKLVQLIHKAAATLREYQSRDKAGSPDGQEMLSEFNEDKRTLCGVTS